MLAHEKKNHRKEGICVAVTSILRAGLGAETCRKHLASPSLQGFVMPSCGLEAAANGEASGLQTSLQKHQALHLHLSIKQKSQSDIAVAIPAPFPWDAGINLVPSN